MIDELHVTNVALVEEATICPARGLTALTGESGSGKTALLSACKLLVGERADAAAIRQGAREMAVEARLFRDGSGHGTAFAQGGVGFEGACEAESAGGVVDDVVAAEEEEGLVVRRTFDVDRRGRVRIDGALASVKELKEQVGSRIELCGQHEHQRLLHASSHLEMLYSWFDEVGQARLSAYRAAFATHAQAAQEFARVQELVATSNERVEQARFVDARIREVAPVEGEYDELEKRLSVAEHADALLRELEEARTTLAGDEGVVDALYTCEQALTTAARYDQSLESQIARVSALSVEAQDIAEALRRAQDGVELDPEELLGMQERFQALTGLLRMFGPRMEDVFAKAQEAAELLSVQSDAAERLAKAEKAQQLAAAAQREAAQLVYASLKEAAPMMAAAITQQLAELEMAGASVTFELALLDEATWTRTGPVKAELMYAPAPKVAPLPLRKIASGGEISRVALAVRVVLGERDDVETLVFDEVDAGVGGTAAVALARVLERLGKTHQVLCVTHLAQVAARAQKQYVVTKGAGDVPVTQVVEVTGQARVEELARMLSGHVSETSLAHAAELLGSA